MNLKISYEEVQKRYPVLVNEIMAKLRSGKSIHKNAKPEDLDWSFDWCQRISGGCRFEDMIAGIMKPKPPRPSHAEPPTVASVFRKERRVIVFIAGIYEPQLIF